MVTRGRMGGVLVWVIALVGPAVLEAGVVRQHRRICPVDEAVGIESLVRFRDRLRAAVQARDVESLRPLVAEDVDATEVGDRANPIVGFEAAVTYHGFRDRSDDSWAEFARILSQGGVMEPGGTFCAPYFTCPAPPYGWEPDEVVVIGYGVPARARPDPAGAVVATLSCDVLRVAQGDDARVGSLRWVGVRLPEGGLAFIEDGLVDQPGLYLRIGKRNGVWKVIELRSID